MDSSQPGNKCRNDFSPALIRSPVISSGHKNKSRKSRSWSYRHNPIIVSEKPANVLGIMSLTGLVEELAVGGSATWSSRSTNAATEKYGVDSMMLLSSAPTGPIQVRKHVFTEDAARATHYYPVVEFIYSDTQPIPNIHRPEGVYITEHIISGTKEDNTAISFVEFVYSDTDDSVFDDSDASSSTPSYENKRTCPSSSVGVGFK
ncbi:hypothetical protein LY76DRAFT_643909 [Colletotrichum caudatum]|nr:hypothetical protein LY76DRAFT_643909 [Colletotrichum caudatum]